MRPVMKGFCRYESLLDCTLTLYDIAEINDAIDVLEENNARVRQAQSK